MDVVGPAVQQKYWTTVGRASLSISNIQETCIDLFKTLKRCVCQRFDRGVDLLGFRGRGERSPQLRGSNSHRGSSHEPTAIVFEVFLHHDSSIEDEE